MNRATLVFVGGFLGAGKTTLITTASTHLIAEGKRVAVILNDQGDRLADTPLLRSSGVHATEIGGGCFCCRYDELMSQAEVLLRLNPDVIFAEPVGSCTDISATVLQPIKAMWGDNFRLAPFTVLVDESRLRDMEHSDPSVRYLISKQMEEADFLCVSKADSSQTTILSGCDFVLSAKTGKGVREWLQAVLQGERPGGARLLDIDYRLYTQAEAALGWLNWQGTLRFSHPLIPAELIGPLLETLDEQLTTKGIKIAHLKLVDKASTQVLKASITDNGQQPSITGTLLGSAELEHDVYLNLRAEGDPEHLRRIVLEALSQSGAKSVQAHLFEAFRPSPPVPQHRFDRVV